MSKTINSVLRHPNGRKVRSNKGKKRKKVNKTTQNEECEIINVNNIKQTLPKNYPGDEWVHQNLLKNRDIDLKYYQQYKPEMLTNTYNLYHNLCYN